MLGRSHFSPAMRASTSEAFVTQPTAWWSSRLPPSNWPLMPRGSCGTAPFGRTRSEWRRLQPSGIVYWARNRNVESFEVWKCCAEGAPTVYSGRKTSGKVCTAEHFRNAPSAEKSLGIVGP